MATRKTSSPAAARKQPAANPAGTRAAARAAKAAPQAKPVASAKAAATGTKTATGRKSTDTAKPKNKLVRDSFTIPKTEYQALGELKQRAAKLERPAKKSELLRAGISALIALGDKALVAALARVPSLKTGRPKRDDVPKA
ncbi:MAG: hypothetical protein H0W40_17070 [Methylibium sp.]|uniref:hypothetical protein n=1 Tax=Methylibium sp. TaxID=2067992 RepID=UPI00183F2124|nr:hypothetical protein [Methylibium sp.]MBA3599064.1 hypothetical protein [Methylibium sp.]